MFHLGVDFGSVFGPKIDQKWTQKSKSQAGEAFQSQKSRWSGLFVLLVLLVSSGLVVWVVPGGWEQSGASPRHPES